MQPPYQPPPGQPPYPSAPYQQGAFHPPPPQVTQSPATPPPLQRDVSVMDALRFTTSGESGWANILFCGLLYLSTQIVPILGLIVMQGFFAEVHRRLVLRHPAPYVRFDFSDFGSYLSRGVAPFVITLVVALPFVVIGLALGFGTFLALGAIAASSASAFGGDRDLVFLIGLGIDSLAFIPLAIFWIVLSNAAVTRAELTGDLSKAFSIGSIWAYGARTWKRVLLTAILMAFVALGLVVVGTLACFIGLFVTMSIQMIANLHLRWQIYNEYLLDGGEPIELARWELLPSEATKPAPYAQPVGGYAAPPGGYTPPPGGYTPPPGGYTPPR